MEDRTEQEFRERIRDLEFNAAKVWFGSVTAVAPLSISLGGSDTPIDDVKQVASSAPLAIGDNIVAIRVRRDVFVLGKLT